MNVSDILKGIGDRINTKANAKNGVKNFVEYAAKIGTPTPDGVGGINTGDGPIKISNGSFSAIPFDLNTIVNDASHIPSSKAVYTALQNAGGGVNIEEGTWTPLIYGYNGPYIYSGIGIYKKIGKLVFIRFMVIPETNNSGSLNVSVITGLPFAGVDQDMPSAFSGFINLVVSNQSTNYRGGNVGATTQINLNTTITLSSNAGITGSGFYMSKN